MSSKRLNRRLSILVIILLALFIGLSWWANRRIYGLRHPDYSSFSNSYYGLSLLHDTLRHMRFPVGILYRPASSAGMGDVVLIVQPSNPRPTMAMTDDILSWVQRGGRLIYLENRQPTLIDRILEGAYYTSFGSMRHYQLGMGEIITGRADLLANANLMTDPLYGQGLAYILASWNPNRIYFAEYYHGFQRANTPFQQLPIALQLAALQLAITAIALSLHLGKRFGRPSPLYEETEREENEQVHSLARLYKLTDRKR